MRSPTPPPPCLVLSFHFDPVGPDFYLLIFNGKPIGYFKCVIFKYFDLRKENWEVEFSEYRKAHQTVNGFLYEKFCMEWQSLKASILQHLVYVNICFALPTWFVLGRRVVSNCLS